MPVAIERRHRHQPDEGVCWHRLVGGGEHAGARSLAVSCTRRGNRKIGTYVALGQGGDQRFATGCPAICSERMRLLNG